MSKPVSHLFAYVFFFRAWVRQGSNLQHVSVGGEVQGDTAPLCRDMVTRPSIPGSLLPSTAAFLSASVREPVLSIKNWHEPGALPKARLVCWKPQHLHDMSGVFFQVCTVNATVFREAWTPGVPQGIVLVLARP